MKKTRILIGFATVFFGLLTLAASAWELPTLSETDKPFTFVVLGDTHYTWPDLRAAALVHSMGDDIKSVHPSPAFVCQTGDLVNRGNKEELAFVMKDLFEAFRLPIFVARGNHDGQVVYRETVLPILATRLGTSLSRNFYAFRYGNSCFVFLDYHPRSYTEQSQFLEDALVQAGKTPGIEHVFVFCHYPLWPVIRAGFYEPKLAESLLSVLRKHPVDAFFCGHTHNTVVCVRRMENVKITQIQGVAAHSGPRFMPIAECRANLLPPDELAYCWGYAERYEPQATASAVMGSKRQACCFCVVVDGRKVDVQWRSPGRGVVREFEWQEPANLRDLKTPKSESAVPVTEAMLKQATAARLLFCPSANDRGKVGLVLNGEAVAQTQINPVLAHMSFWLDQQIVIPKAKLGSLRLANEVKITNPTKALFAIGNARLEITLADGRKVRTTVSPKMFFSSTEAEAQSASPEGVEPAGWRLAPRHMIQAVRLGEVLGPIVLKFPER
ncbi:MAG: metallophosphoesterase [Thermoguttaceae bacterium]